MTKNKIFKDIVVAKINLLKMKHLDYVTLFILKISMSESTLAT